MASRSGFTITIVSTPLNIQALKPKIQADSALDIRLAELPFSSADHGLPPHSENTDSLPYSQVLTLMEAAEYLQPHFENLIRKIYAEDGCNPLCIIGYMFLGWTLDVVDNEDAHCSCPHLALTVKMGHCWTEEAKPAPVVVQAPCSSFWAAGRGAPTIPLPRPAPRLYIPHAYNNRALERVGIRMNRLPAGQLIHHCKA